MNMIYLPFFLFIFGLVSGEESTCPHLGSLQQPLHPLYEGEEFEETISLYDHRKSFYFKTSAFRGDLAHNALLNIRELNLESRKFYLETIKKVGRNVFPLIVLSENDNVLEVGGVGSIATIYFRDGSEESVRPVSEEYEIRKGLSHTVLGVYGILGPYLQILNKTDEWKAPLKVLLTKIDTASTALKLAATNRDKSSEDDFSEVYKDGQVLLNQLHRELTTLLIPGNAYMRDPVASFSKILNSLFGLIKKNTKINTELQMKALIGQLEKWKHELGSVEWAKVYAVVPTIWPVGGLNTRTQALGEVMSEAQMKSQVFTMENLNSVAEYRDTLGRIVGDRNLAQLIFTEKENVYKFALSGKQDLLSYDAEKAIKKLEEENLIF